MLWCGIHWEEPRLNACGIGLIQSDGITATDLATLHYRGVDPNVSPVVLGRCTQDTRYKLLARRIRIRFSSKFKNIQRTGCAS
jgi:hypothetical protein